MFDSAPVRNRLHNLRVYLSVWFVSALCLAFGEHTSDSAPVRNRLHNLRAYLSVWFLLSG